MSEVCLSTSIRCGPPWLVWVSLPRHIHRRPLDLRDVLFPFSLYFFYLVVCVISVTGLVVSYVPSFIKSFLLVR